MIVLKTEKSITETIFANTDSFPLAFGGVCNTFQKVYQAFDWVTQKKDVVSGLQFNTVKEIQKLLQLLHDASTFVFKSLHSNPNFLSSMSLLLNILSHAKGVLASAVHVLELPRPKVVPFESERYFHYFEVCTFTIKTRHKEWMYFYGSNFIQEEFSKHYWKFLKHCLSKTFENFLENKTKESLKPLPSDGEVHPLTSTVLNFLSMFLFQLPQLLPCLLHFPIFFLPTL